uniref:(northern house mosquito) hypothetical protein n=1 Tax=Culex pipiens TaxID=7175 RepID=A0A8D8HK95_CULPI
MSALNSRLPPEALLAADFAGFSFFAVCSGAVFCFCAASSSDDDSSGFAARMRLNFLPAAFFSAGVLPRLVCCSSCCCSFGCSSASSSDFVPITSRICFALSSPNTFSISYRSLCSALSFSFCVGGFLTSAAGFSSSAVFFSTSFSTGLGSGSSAGFAGEICFFGSSFLPNRIGSSFPYTGLVFLVSFRITAAGGTGTVGVAAGATAGRELFGATDAFGAAGRCIGAVDAT